MIALLIFMYHYPLRSITYHHYNNDDDEDEDEDEDEENIVCRESQFSFEPP